MTTVQVRPLPGATFEEHEVRPALADWLRRVTGDGSPIVVVLYGRFTSPRLTPVPVLVTGSVFGGRIYGEAAEIGAEMLAAHAAGLVTLPSSGVDLAVSVVERPGDGGDEGPPVRDVA